MEIELNLDAHQAIKNLTQAGIDEEHAAALVSTFGSFGEKIATKDDLAGIKREMKAMEARQSQRSDYLEKTLTQRDDALEKTLTQEMKAMDTGQSRRSDYLEKNLTNEIAKSRYMMFAAIVAGMIAVVGLYNVLGKFLN